MEKKFYIKPVTEILEFETEQMIAVSPGSFDPDQQQDTPTVNPGSGSTVNPVF